MKTTLKISLVGLVAVLAVVGLALPGVALGGHAVNTISPTTVTPGQTVTFVITGSGFGGGIVPYSISPPADINPPTGNTDPVPGLPADENVRFTVQILPTPASGPRTVELAGHGPTITFNVGSAGVGATPRERIPTTVTTADQFIDLLDTLVDWLFVLLLIGAVVFIVLAGWQFISGGGDPQSVVQARNKLLWAAVGIVIAVLSRGLVAALRNLIT